MPIHTQALAELQSKHADEAKQKITIPIEAKKEFQAWARFLYSIYKKKKAL